MRSYFCHEHNKLREEKFYGEISTVSLDLKTQPGVPSLMNGKRKQTLVGNKGCRTLHPCFGRTVEGICKQIKISYELLVTNRAVTVRY